MIYHWNCCGGSHLCWKNAFSRRETPLTQENPFRDGKIILRCEHTCVFNTEAMLTNRRQTGHQGWGLRNRNSECSTTWNDKLWAIVWVTHWEHGITITVLTWRIWEKDSECCLLRCFTSFISSRRQVANLGINQLSLVKLKFRKAHYWSVNANAFCPLLASFDRRFTSPKTEMTPLVNGL